MRAFLIVSLTACLFACSKQPSIAQPGFEAFINTLAHTHPDKALLASTAKMTSHNAGSPPQVEEDEVQVPINYVGVYDWTKFTPEAEKKLPNGDILITVRTEICMRADGDNVPSCMRPNVYRYEALMRNEGGWKIARAQYVEVSVVR